MSQDRSRPGSKAVARLPDRTDITSLVDSHPLFESPASCRDFMVLIQAFIRFVIIAAASSSVCRDVRPYVRTYVTKEFIGYTFKVHF